MRDNSSPPWIGRQVEVSAREHATRMCEALIKPVRTNSRKESGSLAFHAHSPRGAYTEAIGNGLQASAQMNCRTVVDRRERDGGELSPV